MIEISPENYYVGMWFFEFPERLSRYGKGGDFMLCLQRKLTEPTTWHIIYRFRHKKDGRIWDSDDEKVWFQGTAANKTEAEIERDMQTYIGKISMVAGTVADFFDIHGNGDVMTEKIRLSPPPWMHAKTVDKEEAERQCPKSALNTTSS